MVLNYLNWPDVKSLFTETNVYISRLLSYKCNCWLLDILSLTIHTYSYHFGDFF